MAAENHHRNTYDAVLRLRDAPFVSERPAFFSPAAAAQDEANSSQTYGRFAQMLLPLEYTDWVRECAAHVRSCYLGDWSSLHKVVVRGRQAHAFLSWLGMRDLSRFDHGQIKHHVQLDERGLVASEGILCRLEEEEFLYTAGSADWLLWQLERGGWDAEAQDVTGDRFIFGLQGPRSVYVVEHLIGERVRDLLFGRTRTARIGDAEVLLLRTGISGEVGYEIHGPVSHANEIWTAAAQAGEPHGLQQLGFRSQPVQHIEAGIATNGLDYLPSSILTSGAARQFRRGVPGGSLEPENVTDYFRRPGELGWGFRRGVPARDFQGRDALAAGPGDGRPERVLTGLVWDRDDVGALAAAVLDAGEDMPDPMELPRSRHPDFDQVLLGGRPVGVSTGRTLSLAVRATISLCVVDPAHSAPGTRLTVLWGRPGSAQREIRAITTDLPFKPDHRRDNVAAWD